MCNERIKAALKEKAVYQWQVAEVLGINECSLSRKLRHELNETDSETILSAIERIAATREGVKACL